MLTRHLLWICAAVCFADAAVADGPNLLANSGFKTGLSSWATSAVDSWTAADAGGSPTSGSLKHLNANLNANKGPVAVTQCVPVAPGSYAARLSAWVDGVSGDRAYAQVAFYSDTQCATALNSTFSTNQAKVKAWTHLAANGIAPAGAHSAKLRLLSLRGGTPVGSLTTYFDDTYLGTGACGGPLQLCLNAGRFKVTAQWTDGSQSGNGTAVPYSDQHGSFWLFNVNALDIEARLLNGCAVNNAYWFFASGLTDLQVTLSVTDTKTGVTKTYTNPQGQNFAPIFDTVAFSASCP